MEKQKLKHRYYPLLITVTSICLILSILLPLASYLYFENSLNSKTEIYNLNISSVQEENEKLKLEIANLSQQLGIAQDPFMSKPYLVTNLGWYLHNSSDKIAKNANEFTIYGTVLNVGAIDTQNCSLVIGFYNNGTLLQTAQITIGPIKHWSYITLYPRSVECSFADSTTRIEVAVKGDNVQ
jgi:hypothetical protein